MADEANVQRILEYLRQHSDQYELASLRQQLLDAGYAAEDVVAALDRFGSPPAVEPVPATITLPPAQPTIVLPPDQVTPALPESEQPTPAPSDPLPAPNPEEIIARITAYLNQHQGNYELAALRSQTLAAGYPPDLVEAALSRMAQTPAPADKISFRSGWLPGCGIWALNLLVGGLLSVIATTVDSALSIPIIGLSLLLLIGELVGGFVLRRQGRVRLGNALIWGFIHSVFTTVVLGALLVALIALLFGACVQMFQP